MISRILERFEAEKAKGHYDFNSVIGEKNVWQKAIDIVQEVAKEYEGRVIELPCKVGDTFWEVSDGKICHIYSRR